MAPIRCHLISHSFSEHLQQLYTGFVLLARRGLIELSQECTPERVPVPPGQHLRNSAGAHLRVLLNGRIRLHYDLHDAHEINPDNVERCEFYFKRSYAQAYVDGLRGLRERILPFGLHYNVLPDGVDLQMLERALRLPRASGSRLRAILAALDAGNWLHYSARLRHLEALPDCDLPPRVLFLVNAYDPHDPPDRTPQKVDEYVAVNELRARCIRLLRSALGPRFLGGFTHNTYTRRAYPDVLVERHALTRRRNYLRLLRSYSICVATGGLHGSIGWKFGEYVALSKAIVCERLNYEVPGELQEGRNYLAFETPEQCVALCARLIEDGATRTQLMVNNALYYRSHLRPDSLVLNTLLRALPGLEQAPAQFAAVRRPGSSQTRLGNSPIQ